MKKDSPQPNVYTEAVSVLQVFSTREVCRHNITHPQGKLVYKKE